MPYKEVHPFAVRTIMSTELMPLAAAQSYERQAVGRVLRYPQVCPARYCSPRHRMLFDSRDES